MKMNVIAVKTINYLNQTVNLAVLLITIALITFAGYALWDSNKLYQAADKSHYAVYKPSIKDEGKSFEALQAINAEVIAWLSVYGTNIDYPVTQGPDNMKYVDTDAEGRYSLSGSIFLDSNNKRDFSDYNNILHGHHMAKNVMFGEIGNFSDRKIFDAHQYGNLYIAEKDFGLEFFAFIHADAYDISIFSPGIKAENRQVYFDNLLAHATHIRDVDVTPDDRLILLSTCSSRSTNGRDILVGRITNNIFRDPSITMQANDGKSRDNDQDIVIGKIHLMDILLIALLTAVISVIHYIRKNKKGVEKND